MAEKRKTTKRKVKRIKEPTLTARIQRGVKRQQEAFRKKFPETPEGKKRRETVTKFRKTRRK